MFTRFVGWWYRAWIEQAIDNARRAKAGEYMGRAIRFRCSRWARHSLASILDAKLKEVDDRLWATSWREVGSSHEYSWGYYGVRYGNLVVIMSR